MTNEDWKYKIINASPQRLVIVTYEIILDRIKSAGILYERGDLEGFRAKTNNAREFVSEMICALDRSYSVSRELLDLYFLVNRLLAKACSVSCKKTEGDSYKDVVQKQLGAAAEIIERLMNGLKGEVADAADICAAASDTYSSFAGYCGLLGSRAAHGGYSAI